MPCRRSRWPIASTTRSARPRRFVSFFYAVLDPDTRELVYCNGGHNPPFLVRANGDVERLTDGGMVLGVMDQSTYEQGAVTLRRGDRLVLFTDGINEAI